VEVVAQHPAAAEAEPHVEPPRGDAELVDALRVVAVAGHREVGEEVLEPGGRIKRA
jgi:hypothetical protein